MQTVENEDLIRQEIERLEENNEAIGDCNDLLEIIKRVAALDPSEITKAEDRLEEVWKAKPQLTIETIMNILALDSKRNIDDHLHKVICTVLTVYLGKATLNSDSHEDANILIHWLNKMTFLAFARTQSDVKLQSICQPLVKLFSYYDFFANQEFTDEVYYRFVKKHFEECQSENKLSKPKSNLAKLLCFLDILMQEDERVMTYSIPKVINDAISSLSACSEELCRHAFKEDQPRTLEYIQRINSTMAELVKALNTHFSKYCSQALDILTNKNLTSHLAIVSRS